MTESERKTGIVWSIGHVVQMYKRLPAMALLSRGRNMESKKSVH